MDLSAYLQNAVAAGRRETFEKSDQLTLGEIISKCEAIQAASVREKEPSVQFDFEYIVPSGIDSWRGSYNELCIHFSVDGTAPKLSDFIKMLKDAVGKEFTGYKGGEFTMTRHTPVWVANYGNSGNTAVIDVVDGGYFVMLVTGYREF